MLLFIALCLFFSCDSSTPEADVIPSGERYDSVTNTYYVNSESGLKTWAEAAKSDPSTNCVLLSDIILSNPSEDVSNWNPVADYTGTFDGQYHTITDVSVVILTNGTQNYGFFRSIERGGVVKDLRLEDIYIYNLSGYIGGIAGSSDGGSISNCTVSGTIKSSGGAYAGGIIGRTSGSTTISNCINSCDVISEGTDPTAGGIAGQARSCNILECENYGDITVRGYNSVQGGGIAGGISDTAVKSCLNRGNIIGENTAKTTALTSSQRLYSGAIVGAAYSSTITDCTIEECTIKATYYSASNPAVSVDYIAGHVANTCTLSENTGEDKVQITKEGLSNPTTSTST